MDTITEIASCRWRLSTALFLSLLLLMSGAPSALRADIDVEAVETDETINKSVKALRDDQRESEKIDSNLKRLKTQNKETQFRKRTGTSFRSDRTLRHDLRRNEARQGWQKSEGRRLDYEVQRRQRELRSQTQEWRRAR